MNSIIAEFSIVPIGQESTSLTRWVARAIEAIARVEGVEYELTPMGTVLEASSMEAIFRCVQAAHDALSEMGAERMLSHLSINDRRDVSRGMGDKPRSVRRHLEGDHQ